MKYLILVFIFFKSFHHLSAQDFKWHYPWRNPILEKGEALENDIIPVFLKGKSYRILEVTSTTPFVVSAIETRPTNTEVDVFALPVIKDYRNREIVDIIFPFEQNKLEYDTVKYFLLVFNGEIPGPKDLEILIALNGKQYSLKKSIVVSHSAQPDELNLNVWAYFDYDFLTKGIKQQVIDDLLCHKNNLLVIPPFHLPKVGKNIKEDGIKRLDNYLEGTLDKFAYYVLYLGYDEKDQYVMSEEWRKYFVTWVGKINSFFKSNGITEDRVFIYPFDEPKGEAIDVLSEMFDWSRSEGIKNPFYVTIGGRDRTKSIQLVKKIDYAQVASKIVADAVRIKGENTTIFSYSVIGQSRNIQPDRYRALGIEAYLKGISGIGVWQYSDMRRAVDGTAINSFSKGEGSWNMEIKDHSKDFSIIYRRKDLLYPSLRWKALSYGVEEFKYLKVFEDRYGRVKAGELSHDLSSGKIDDIEWEKIKVELLSQETSEYSE